MVTTAGALLALTACGSPGSGSGEGSATGSAAAGQVKVVAAFYPLAYAAEQVGGDSVAVSTLTPPGVEPHDLELTPAQVAQIKDADVVLYVPGFMPAVDQAVAQQAQGKAVDASAGIAPLTTDGGQDPHVWLDPASMTTIGANTAAAIEKAAPGNAAAVRSNQASFAGEMSALSQEFTTGLAQCTIKDLVVSHAAFGYLARAYGFTQVGISGLSPDAEPSPARVAEVSNLVRNNGVTTVYYETLVDPKVAETVAKEAGAQSAVLDPIEGLSQGSDQNYQTLMQANLKALVQGQACQ
ncbi:MAG: hypothetical protein RLZ55_1827 [Actinomycetota bacterium]